MSRKLHEPALVGSPELVRLSFRLQSAGAATSAPDFVVPSGVPVSSVTHASTGVYAITFAEKFPVFVGGFARVMPASGGLSGLVCNLAVADYDTSTGVLTVRVGGPTAANDVTQIATIVPNNDWLFVDVVFCRRSAMAPQRSDLTNGYPRDFA